MSDISLSINANDGLFHVGLSTLAGDIKTDDGLKTAVLYSLFTDRIASDDDVIPDGSTNKRGHWADAYLADNKDSEGSRLWLLSREKQNTEVLNRAETYANESLQWMIDDGIISNITVNASWLRVGVLVLQITLDVINAQNFSDIFEVTI